MAKRGAEYFFAILLFVRLSYSGTDPESPKQIIEKMKQAYITCRTYQDSGAVDFISVRKADKQIDRMPFKTYFVRPNMFRFEWKGQFFPQGKQFSFVIWCNEKETFTYWGTGELKKMDTLEGAIKANAGVSRGASSTVPSLLLCPQNSSILTKLKDWILAKEETIDNVVCFLITATYIRSGEEINLWIGKNDFLLRKLRRTISQTISSEEVHQDIIIGQDIPKEVFLFKPPGR